MSLRQRLKRLDDAVLPRAGSHRIERRTSPATCRCRMPDAINAGCSVSPSPVVTWGVTLSDVSDMTRVEVSRVGGEAMTMSDPAQRYEQAYGAYSALILAYAARRTDHLEDAADIVAETFTVAWRRIDQMPAGDQARPWLYGVARKVLANHHRSHRRRRRLDERLAAEVADLARLATVAPGTDGLEGDAVAMALRQLSDSDRELLMLIGWEGLTPSETATALGCSKTTARVRLHRARRRFDEQLRLVGVKRPGSSGHESDKWAARPADPEEAR